jgi:hypothetical protein
LKSLVAKIALLCALPLAPVFAADWRVIDPTELSQKTPKVEPNADAEAIFWDVRVEDRQQGGDLSLSLVHYIRIKIFTDRGKEHATIEIPEVGRRRVSDVAGRTIKADGSIIELKKDAIFDRELAKTKGAKVRGKTFVLPNVETGDIIEYRYRETHDNETASYMRLYFQRDLPMWNVTYHVKPLTASWFPYGMRTMAFQIKHPPIQKEPDGFYSIAASNIPAFKEEPYMPPEDQLRAWMLIYYEEDRKIDPDKFWKELGQRDFNRLKPLLKPDDLVKRTAAEVTSGIDKPEAKLTALDTFCRTKIRNLNSPAFHVTADERKQVKENRSPGDTLKQKTGYSADVDFLFAAMATAAGFDARLARIPSRGDTFFSPKAPTTYFVNNFSVAVKVGDKWTFFDPSTPYLEPGMLRWQEEGQPALVSDPKEGFFTNTQFTSPAKSKRDRRADLKLLEDGTVEGTLTYTFTGHQSESDKRTYQDKTPAQQEESWKESMENRLSTLEMSDFHIQGVDDPAKALSVQCKVKVPGYATRTGRRILFQPAYFERNFTSRFTETTRTWDIYFPFGWSEDDEITIELPEGWELDQPVVPASSNLGNTGEYKIELRKTTDGRKLIYKRHFEFGKDQTLLMPATAYAQVKKVFDFVQEQDNFSLSLKQATSGK